jgi:DNA polymerase
MGIAAASSYFGSPVQFAGGVAPQRPGLRQLDRDHGRMSPEQAISRLRNEAEGCRACPLWRHATQTVFGEGHAPAPVMLVGEQPGNEEDKQGHPFVGPAGTLLERALDAAGIARDDVYVTNAVKHFKWEPRGKRRIHKTPAQREIDACNRWLSAEIEAVKPRLIVCLGATAGRAVLGHAVRIGTLRGTVYTAPERPGQQVAVTYHPAYVLRQRDQERFAEAYQELVSDLRAVARVLHEPARRAPILQSPASVHRPSA